MSETPILSLQQPLPAPRDTRTRKIIGYIIGGLIALLIGVHDELPVHWNPPLPGFNGLLLLPYLFVAVAIHEFGHLMAGRLAGLDAGGISIGPLRAHRSGSRWVYRLDWSRWAGGTFLPLTGIAGTSAKGFGIMVAGGPGASLICALLAIAGWALWGDGGYENLGTFFWTSVAVCSLSLLPIADGTTRSDGARLWQVATSPDSMPPLFAALQVQSSDARGTRPRDWDAGHVSLMTTVRPETSEYIAVNLLLFYRKLDQGLEAEALEHLEKTLEHCGRAKPLVRRALLMEAAASSALLRGNVAHAREWHQRALAIRRKPPQHVVLAAIAMLEARYEDSIASWVAARERVDRLKLGSGVIQVAKEKWAEREQICREALGGRAAATGS